LSPPSSDQGAGEVEEAEVVLGLDAPRLAPLLEAAVRQTQRADCGRVPRVPHSVLADPEPDPVHRVPARHTRVVATSKYVSQPGL